MVQNTRKCSIDGCENPVRARGWCSRHYYKWHQYGDPLANNVYARSPEEAFQRYTTWQDECLMWVAGKSAHGYGVIHFGGKSHPAHRYAWERINGPIPEGLEVDHVCWNKLCVNIRHLRLATASQNGSYLRGGHKGTSSGVRNVSWDKNKWRVVVKKNGQYHYFGRYSNLEEAAEVAENAREELFGEFAGKG